MSRVKKSVQARNKHKKVLKLAKGYRGSRSKTYKVAKQAVMKAGQYAYRDRRVKKRVFRSLWIVRINAAVRQEGMTYSVFILLFSRPKLLVPKFPARFARRKLTTSDSSFGLFSDF